MRKFIYSLLLVGCVVVFHSCQKDLDQFIPDPNQLNGPDTAWVAQIGPTTPIAVLRKNILVQPETINFVADAVADTLYTSNGLKLYIPANGFSSNSGSTASGNVQLATYLIQKKGDMIRMNKPTVSSDLRQMELIGTLFLQPTLNADTLHVTPNMSIRVDFPVQNFILNHSRIFTPSITSSLKRWELEPDSVNNNIIYYNSKYIVNTRKTGWIGCGYFIDATATSTIVDAALPVNYTNANTMVYLVYDNFPSVVELNADFSSRKFSSIPLPAGQTAKLIILSRQENDYYLGYQSITTSGSIGQHQVVSITPTRTNLQNVLGFLDSL